MIGTVEIRAYKALVYFKTLRLLAGSHSMQVEMEKTASTYGYPDLRYTIITL